MFGSVFGAGRGGGVGCSRRLKIVQADWQLTDSARKAGRRSKCHRPSAARLPPGLVAHLNCAESSSLRACGSASQQIA